MSVNSEVVNYIKIMYLATLSYNITLTTLLLTLK